MNSNKNLMDTIFPVTELTYFDQLPGEMQCVVADFLNMISELNDNTDQVFISEDLDEVECRRRDGFFPHSWNKGGLELKAHSTLYAFWSGNMSLTGEGQEAADESIDITMKLARETFIENNKEEITKLGLKVEQIDYHTLYELGHGMLAEKLSEYETENLEDDYSSTLHQVRIIYSGEGTWAVDVMHRISDAPYHRECDESAEFKFVAKDVDSLVKNLAKIESKVLKAFI